VTVHVKICGIVRPEDAVVCADLGASAIGLNFVDSSPRRITPARAREIADAVRGRKLLVVGVVANMTVPAMRALVAEAGLGCLQLSGDETADVLEPLLPHAYKAVRIGGEDDVALARTYPGEHLLVDSKVKGSLGGTGVAFDWSLVRELATSKKLTLAGGLRPDNVADAVRAVRPYCVDVASGVERAPGDKDWDLVHAFLAAASGA
jgi:phosphoribosylanthranilate isomerase